MTSILRKVLALPIRTPVLREASSRLNGVQHIWVLLLHDIRDEDSTDIGGIIDEIEAYANSKNVVINYRRVTDLQVALT